MDTKVISSGVRHTRLPESYVRPESERPNLSEVSDCQNVPVIDLGSGDRTLIVRQVGDACRDYGFFQVRLFLFYFYLGLIYNDTIHNCSLAINTYFQSRDREYKPRLLLTLKMI